jgi:hypothetical protein
VLSSSPSLSSCGNAVPIFGSWSCPRVIMSALRIVPAPIPVWWVCPSPHVSPGPGPGSAWGSGPCVLVLSSLLGPSPGPCALMLLSLLGPSPSPCALMSSSLTPLQCGGPVLVLVWLVWLMVLSPGPVSLCQPLASSPPPSLCGGFVPALTSALVLVLAQLSLQVAPVGHGPVPVCVRCPHFGPSHRPCLSRGVVVVANRKLTHHLTVDLARCMHATQIETPLNYVSF